MTKQKHARSGAAPVQGQEAELTYGNADFAIKQPGDFVRCAATGERIDLDDLHYWSVEHQEPYLDAVASLQRMEGRRDSEPD